MIINNFKLFENLSIGAIERGEHFQLNESMNEGIWTSIANFFSKMVGGSVSKLDKILRRYEDAELDYWNDWADARSKSAEAEVLSNQTKSDPVQVAKYKEQKERIQKLLTQVDKKHDDVKDALTRQANSIIKDSERLKDYWEMKKAKIDEDAAKAAYDEIKKSTDDDTIHDLFDNEIQRASKIAKKKEEEFKNKYPGNSFSTAPSEEDSEGLIVSGINIKDLMMKPISDNQAKLKNLAGADIKKVFDVFNDTINDEIKFIKSTVSDKEQQFKQTSDIYKNTKPKLDYIKQLLVNADSGNKEEVKAEIKSNPEMVTDVTKKELGTQGTDKAIQAAVVATGQKTPDASEVTEEINDQVKKNFQSAKGTIEEAVGDTIEDTAYTHLKNDMIALYGKLVVYYNGLKKNVPAKTLQFGLIDFAAELYKYKKENNQLGEDLNDKDLTAQFDKYSK